MEKFTNFAKDAMEGLLSLHLLARLVKIGPKHMSTFKKHAAYNTSALALVAALLAISINLYAPVAPIGYATGLLATIVAWVFVGLVGFVVNLAAPADDVFVSDDGESDNVSGLTNKWATYFALNFVVMILVFIAVNGATSVFSEEGLPSVSYMISVGYSYDFSVFSLLATCSLISSLFVFSFCKISNKIVDRWQATTGLFVITNVVCTGLFYLLHYQLFS